MSEEDGKYEAWWIPDGDYIVGDYEYGYELCRINVCSEMKEKLSSGQIKNLMNKIALLIDSEIEAG